MHEARKEKGFPTPPPGSPLWIYMFISIIDDPNPDKRQYKFHKWVSGFSKTPEARAQDAKEEEELKSKNKQDFIKMAQRGWLQIEKFEEWRWKFAWTLENDYDFYLREAQQALLTIKAVATAKDAIKYAVLNGDNIANLPTGTKLYVNSRHYLSKLESFKYATKIDQNEWKTSNGNIVSDAYFLNQLKYSTHEYILFLLEPIEKFENKFIQYSPDKKEIFSFINKLLKEDPELFLDPYHWDDADKLGRTDDIYFLTNQLLKLHNLYTGHNF